VNCSETKSRQEHVRSKSLPQRFSWRRFSRPENETRRCIYLALEEREEDLKNDFRAMGADGSEPVYTCAAAAPAEGIEAAFDLVRQRRPVLVVIDPLFRLARIKDEKAYAETYAALGPLEGKTGLKRKALRALATREKIAREGGGKRGDPYKYAFSFSCSRALLAELRKDREKVRAFLQDRALVPAMPPGARLVRWEPKQAPVILTHYAVVTDVFRFISMTLVELKAALAGKRWQSGHRTVRELVDRLEQCGVILQVSGVEARQPDGIKAKYGVQPCD
jgi:hypothetical protein